MNRLSRAVATLAAAVIAGVLLWAAAHVGRHTTGGYWAAYGIVAGAGLVLALSQIRGRRGNPPAMFGLAFLPVLVMAGWVLVAEQPHGNWFRHHVLSWSESLGIDYVVTSLAVWLGVLAFGIGYTLGLVLEPAPAPVEPVVVPPTHDRVAADEPVAAERREVAATDGTRTAPRTDRSRNEAPVRR
jgi:hypothetical protein